MCWQAHSVPASFSALLLCPVALAMTSYSKVGMKYQFPALSKHLQARRALYQLRHLSLPCLCMLPLHVAIRYMGVKCSGTAFILKYSHHWCHHDSIINQINAILTTHYHVLG